MFHSPMRLITASFLLISLTLLVSCNPTLEKAQEYATATEDKGVKFYSELANLCSPGYFLNYGKSQIFWNGKGWRINTDLNVSLGAEARSVEEAIRSSRRDIAGFMECMFVADKYDQVADIQVKLTFRDIEDLFNPLTLGVYRIQIEKLDELDSWKEKPPFLDRHRVSQFIESNMETVHEDWSEIILE